MRRSRSEAIQSSIDVHEPQRLEASAPAFSSEMRRSRRELDLAVSRSKCRQRRSSQSRLLAS
eukprot:2971769-Pleurochrysis_carterae.AAC.1